LLRETGKTVLQHTFEAARRSQRAEAVVIATDDQEIAVEARRFGALVEMTRSDCASGTDRVAEVVRRTATADIVLNVQGDEPEIDAASIDQLFDLLAQHPEVSMATLATPITSREALYDPACVKVVLDAQGRALYFSRSPIPCPRQFSDALLTAEPPNFLQHLGVYAYRRDLLLKLSQIPPGRLEAVESLEQLRVLQAGETILVAVVDEATRGIDTPADYEAFVARHRAA
jgi:3-deoxy-manno-octulosonate cytidylyltransferase (CMP-KDO synthetase)